MTPENMKLFASGTAVILILVLYLAIWIGMAIGMGCIAARLKKSVVLWVILSLIPVYNFFFWYYVGFVVVLRMLDRLNQISARLDGSSAPVNA